MKKLLLMLVLVGCASAAPTHVEMPDTKTQVVREKHMASFGDFPKYDYFLISEDNLWAEVEWEGFCKARVGKEFEADWKLP